MKAVILAGGLGTRISEESHLKPKPMIEIGGKPILWHIMKQYSAHGIHDFVICLGYKGYAIKDFFANYFLHTSDVTFDMRENRMDVHQNYSEPWRVTLIDTGEETMTGGRLRRAGRYLQDEEAFCFTYGDGVSDLNIGALVDFHRAHGKHATVTAGLFGKAQDAVAVALQGAVTARRLHRGDGRVLAVGPVEVHQGADIQVGHAVALGEAEGFFILQIAAGPAQTAAGHGFLTSVDQGHAPGLAVVLVNVHAIFPHVEGDVGGVQEVVSEE
ncbi:sugar phosphate nucleotidyltransferase, partial [Pseudomonas chlororaphis]